MNNILIPLITGLLGLFTGFITGVLLSGSGRASYEEDLVLLKGKIRELSIELDKKDTKLRKGNTNYHLLRSFMLLNYPKIDLEYKEWLERRKNGRTKNKWNERRVIKFL